MPPRADAALNRRGWPPRAALAPTFRATSLGPVAVGTCIAVTIMGAQFSRSTASLTTAYAAAVLLSTAGAAFALDDAAATTIAASPTTLAGRRALRIGLVLAVSTTTRWRSVSARPRSTSSTCRCESPPWIPKRTSPARDPGCVASVHPGLLISRRPKCQPPTSVPYTASGRWTRDAHSRVRRRKGVQWRRWCLNSGHRRGMCQDIGDTEVGVADGHGQVSRRSACAGGSAGR